MTFDVIDLITDSPPNLNEIARTELWAISLCYTDMEGFSLEEDGTLCLVDECGHFVYCPRNRFKIIFHFNGTDFEEIY